MERAKQTARMLALVTLVTAFSLAARGHWRRYTGSRARAATGRRSFHRESGDGYLLDYADANFTRPSEAANIDPRIAGWPFVKGTTETEHLAITYVDNSLPLTENITWDVAGGATIDSTTETDPLGGTNAVRMSDTGASGGFDLALSDAALAYTTNDDVWLSYWAEKDPTATTFFEVGLEFNGNLFASVIVDQTTGRWATRVGSPTGTYVAEHNGWYFVAFRYIGTTAPLKARVFPAVGLTSVFPAISSAAAGSVTLWGLRIGNATTLSEAGAHPNTPWAGSDMPRIQSDGAILIEGARTNLLEESADFTQAIWSKSNISTAAGKAAPDASTSGVELIDASASYGFVSNGSATATATKYSFSCYLKKDSDTSRFPGIALIDGTVRRAMFNSQTGAVNDITANFDSLTSSDEGDFWRIEATFTSNGTAVTTYFYSALGTVWGTIAAAATGSALFWGAQLEKAPVPSSPTRASGVATTGALDDATQATYAIASGKWEVDFWPMDASGVAGLASQYLFFQGAGGYLRFEPSIGQLTFRRNGVVKSTLCTWSARQKLTVKVDFDAGELTLSGFTVGDGTVAMGGAGDWSTDAITLSIGQSNAATAQANAVISRPRAA